MDISIEDAFDHAREHAVIDTETAGELDNVIRGLLTLNAEDVPPAVKNWAAHAAIQAFAAGIVYQSQFTGKVNVEMDSELVSEFLLFLAGRQ